MPSVGDLSDLLHPFESATDWAKSKPANEAPASGSGPTVDPNPSRGTHLTTSGKIVLGALALIVLLYVGKKSVDKFLAPVPPVSK